MKSNLLFSRNFQNWLKGLSKVTLFVSRHFLNDTMKNNHVKKPNKVSEARTHSKLSMNRKNPSVRKYAANQKSEMINLT